MQLVNHFLRLREHFPDSNEGTQLSVSLQQLADILCCTSRNANLLLKRMSQAGWINWSAGRGRGNLSLLTFLVASETLLVEQAQEQVRKGDIREALDLVNETQVSQKKKTQFIEWLNDQFGFYTEAQERRKVDTLRFPLHKRLGKIDPAFALFTKEAHMLRQIFDCLVTFNPVSKQIEPHLAYYWEANENCTEWTFYLRKNIMFHDGQECTSKDVAFTIRRLMDADLHSPYRWMFSSVVEILTPDDHRITIRLQQPNHLFLHYVAAPHVSILPEHQLRKYGDAFFQSPVGTGPFQASQYDDVKLVLEAFPSYFQERAHLDRLEIWFIPEIENDKPETDAFQMRYFSSKHRSADISPDWCKIEQIQAGCKYLSLNLSKKGPQQHLTFRLALKHALDYQRLIEELGDTQYIPASSLLPEQEPSNITSAYDPDRAMQLLQESGYRGETLRLFTYPHREKEARLIAHMCGEAGIQIDVSLHSAHELIYTAKGREADLICSDVVFDDDILFSLLETMQTEYSYVHAHLGPELSSLLERSLAHILQEPDHQRQFARLLQWGQHIIDQGAIIPLCRHKQTTYYHPALKGVSLSSFGWVSFKDIWFHPDRL